jgi:hypothetical protein
MATVFLPYALRKYADGAERVEIAAKTLGELIDNLETAYPGTGDHPLKKVGSSRGWRQLWAIWRPEEVCYRS